MQHPIERATAQEVTLPSQDDVILPRSLAFYEAQADRAEGQRTLEDALGQALHDIFLTPRRYAELMRLLDTWLVEDHIAFVDHYFSSFTRTQGGATP